MQKSNKAPSNKTTTTTSKKQNDFDAVFAKYAAQLPPDYVGQFKKPEFKGKTKEAKIKDAMRTGKKVEVVQKTQGNKQGAVLNVGKLLEDDHVIEIKEVPKEISNQVAKARAEKKLTQAQLATKVNVVESVIVDLEKGDGMYDPKLVEKIEKTLSIKFDRSWKK